jgi:hypothetical protein
MAVRSFVIELTNQTGSRLQLINGGPIPSGLYGGGEWSTGLNAPPSIEADASVNFGTESDGVLVGTEAWVLYQVLDNSPLQPDPNDPSGPLVPCTSWIYIHWDNPYEGGSTYANSTIVTVLVNSQGGPVNSNTGPSVFVSKPLISTYEIGSANAPQTSGSVRADVNWGDVVPFVAPWALFADGNIAPHGDAGWLARKKATDLGTWAKRNKADLAKGVRVLNPPTGSLRALLQLPLAVP